jgi:uncharacterized membrane protein YcaP (DUF421 family)
MENYLIISLRTVIGFIIFFVLMKFMGKREIGQLSLFDLIIILSIADLMVLGIDGFDRDILYSIIPMIIVAVIQKLLALISLKISASRTIVDGDASYIIIDGKINIKEMKKLNYNMSDLYSQLRGCGVRAIQEIEFGILESNGRLSVFKKQEELNVSLPIIVSGKIDKTVLKMIGKNEKWLNEKIHNLQINKEEILGACLVNNELQLVECIEYSD